jgi:hypothetical protein
MEAPFETKRVFEHLDKLVYEIGPRSGGSKAEREAAAYAEQEFKKCGLKVRIQRFRFFRPRFLLLLLLSFPASLLLRPALALAVWLALLLLALSGRVESQNVLAGSGKAKLILVAQLDSGPCRRFPPFLAALGFSSITLLLILRLFFEFPVWPFLPLWLLPLPASFRTEFSPGANDASGLAVLLELARIVKKDILFVVVGSSELSSSGVRALKKVLPRAPVVCVERVGGKTLTWAGQDLGLQLKKGVPGNLCRRFLSLGFTSFSLSSEGPHLDTPDDLPERLSAETIESAGLSLLELVDKFAKLPKEPPEEIFVEAGSHITEPLVREAKRGSDKAEKLLKTVQIENRRK